MSDRDNARFATCVGPIHGVSDSTALGWQQVAADICREDAHTEAFETATVPELLIVVVTSGTYQIQCAKGPRWYSALYHPGSVGVTAPGCSSVLRWDSDGTSGLESVHVRVGTDLLEETAQALSARPAVFPDALSLDDPYVAAAAAALGRVVRYQAPPLYADTVAHAMAAHLVCRRAPSYATPRVSGGLSEAALARVIDYIRDYLASDLRVDELAAVAHLSVFHFVRMFRVSTGTTPHRYITGVRMRRAAVLLKQSTRPISLIASDVAYRSPGQFSAAFRREFGCTPASYRADD